MYVVHIAYIYKKIASGENVISPILKGSSASVRLN